MRSADQQSRHLGSCAAESQAREGIVPGVISIVYVMGLFLALVAVKLPGTADEATFSSVLLVV